MRFGLLTFRSRRRPEPWVQRDSALRLAVIGTPRSGNTWLRRLLATGLAIGGDDGREFAVHDPGTIDWEGGNARYIVQVHVRRDPALAGVLNRHGVRVIVPFRHPYDTLISILQYVIHAPGESAQWLLGENGNEDAIRGLDPCHPRFLDYARSARASALLGVSPSWREEPTSVKLRYEDLTADPEATLERVAREIGERPRRAWAAAVASNSMESLRRMHGTGHVWKGQPGLWRSLLTPEAAAALFEAHGPLLKAHGGTAGADPLLTPEQALANWRALIAPDDARPTH